MPSWAHRTLILAATAALLVACAPITREAGQAAPGSTIPIPTATATLEPTPDTTAMATVITRALRVRGEPTVNSRLIGELANGEAYPVVARSSDGMWLELELPQFEAGSGWVSVDLVTMRGDITDLPIVKIPTPVPPTLTPVAQLPTATPEAAVVTSTMDSNAVVTDTAEAAVEATAEPTAEPTVEPTAEPVVEATVEATTEPSVPETAPISETAVITETTPETPAPAATAEGIAAPAAGSATVTADWRVRIRAEPNTEAPIVGFGYRGETFPVLEVSSDGQWVRLGGSPATPENTEGGWVSAAFLVLGQ